MSAFPPVGILATGSYLPAHEVPSAEVAHLVGVEPGWIEHKTRIRARRWAAPEEATSDLAARAAADALAHAGIAPEQINYLVVSTSTGDHPMPPTSSLVQSALPGMRAACFDVNAVCSGFVYAVALARGLLSLAPGAHALVIGADIYSRILDFGDRRTAVLFGDGAGAAVLGPVPEGYGIIDLDLLNHRDTDHLIRIEAGGSRRPPTRETVDAGEHYFRMDGRGVRGFVMEHVPPALTALVKRTGYNLDDVDHFVAHQANGVLLDEIVEQSGLGGARTLHTLERYGNVGSASVPVTLDEVNRAGALADGELVLLAGFGGGMAVGACLLRWWGNSKGERTR
ncbi:3-oxoacyl-ACP synthase III family protein [Paractinoplanes durhamensis]|uniref:3-oxoacyl-[acyl-carrier-protein] synthase 3 n=1 Tax=Paractinoplanes durhamensis TaxID=113563 RepID=A0ABQ3ZDG7_9ACTN|nr:ketoacyl-ACP synthase III [Actinoplanes durhamensis]GIE07883.1 3-oxoacyl-[acyl-carrier-protein] synthase 3 [Actinoplanes durhamensis]